ncbi:MAG: hypothetical protein GX175_00315 [Halanaerobiaceae bacterium]|nr:hypothetical protein [Halanaerobiaceae bacterium]
MDILRIISEGISNDLISLAVFHVLTAMFIVDIFLYIIIWVNIISFNRKLKNGYTYKEPLRGLLEGFDDLIKRSVNEINTGAYVEDFFSRYKATVFPIPLLDFIKLPLISTIKFIKETVSLFILVGVLGTFVGIYVSLSSLLGGPDGLITSLDTIYPVLSGMGTAFATSIVGMSLSMTTTLLLKIFNAEQFLTGVMVRTENYLDNEIKISEKSFVTNALRNIYLKLERGFGELLEQNERVYNAIRGFEQFSLQFKEAATYMEDFNTNLAGSMSDLKDFYQTNRDFTAGFARDVHILSSKLEALFNVIDELNKHQESIGQLINNNYDVQLENIATLKGIREDISGCQEDLKENYQLFREQLKDDRNKLSELFTALEENLERQHRVAEDYKEIVENIGKLRKEVAVTFEENAQVLTQAMSEIKDSYSNEMSRNVKIFLEHVGLSNRIISKALSSLESKFQENEAVLAKYLGGLAFNAHDLEAVVKELTDVVREMDRNIREYNKGIKEYSRLIESEQERILNVRPD